MDRIRKISKIIVHHSLTKDSGTLSWSAIRRYHTVTRRWLDIGYHAGVELVGNEFECLFGRPTSQVGAHAAGHNQDSLGICFVGNFDLEEPGRDRLVVAAHRVLAPWCREFDLQPTDIVPHRDFSSKTCPGRLFDMALLRSIVEADLRDAA